MPPNRRTIRSIFALATTALAAFAPEAEASPTLTYKVTNLGLVSASTPHYGSDAGGGLVFAADGSAYRFNPPSSSAAPTDGLPLVLETYRAYTDYGNPANRYNGVTRAYQNSNGFKVYFESTGINGHPWLGSTGLVAMQAGGGVAQHPVQIANVPNNADGLTFSGVNELGQVLFRESYTAHFNGGWPGASVYLYDSASGNTVDVGALTGSIDPADLTWPVALDDQGRILVTAAGIHGEPADLESRKMTTDLLMYTPTNLDDSPVQVPEPSLIAFAACVAAGMAIRNVRRTRTA